MWLALKDWFLKHKILIGIVLCFSLVVGIAVPLISLFYPAVLATIITFNFLSWAPFAFMVHMNLALSLPTLGLIMIGITNGVCVAASFVCYQLYSIGQHVVSLVLSKKTDLEFINTSPYVHKHLRALSNDIFDNDLEDEFNPLPTQVINNTNQTEDVCSDKNEFDQSGVKVENTKVAAI